MKPDGGSGASRSLKSGPFMQKKRMKAFWRYDPGRGTTTTTTIYKYIGGRVYPNLHILSLRTLGISWSKILGCCCCSAALDRTASNSLKIHSSFFTRTDLPDLISEIWTRHYHHPASNCDPRLFHFIKNQKCK